MGIERRKYKRFSLIKEFARQVDLCLITEDHQKNTHIQNLPGIIVNLSAGGVAILTFTDIPNTATINLRFDIPGLPKVDIKSRLIYSLKKGDTYLLGMEFKNLSQQYKEKINKMAEDYYKCEERINNHIKNECVQWCEYFPLCGKKQKRSVIRT